MQRISSQPYAPRRRAMMQMAARFCLMLVVLGAALVNAAAVRAQGLEEIRLFEARIAIGDDGALTVTETITVNAAGQQIKRGIFRDFPTRYYDPDTGLVAHRLLRGSRRAAQRRRGTLVHRGHGRGHAGLHRREG